MKTAQKHAVNESSQLHTLVPIESDAKRHRAKIFYVGLVALILGVMGAMVWLARPQMGGLERLQQEPVAQAPTASSSATVIPTSNLPKSQAGAAVAIVVPTRSPTRTPTAIPFLDRIEGVVGLGGAELWQAATGMFVRTLAQGELLTVDERSADGSWLHVQAEDGTDGWVASDDVIVFDTERLQPRDVMLIPITPTPTTMALTTTESAEPIAEVATLESFMPDATATGVATSGDERATGRVVGMDTRLNVRSGPGAGFRVIAKALPGESFVLLGQDRDGEWLQIELSDAENGFGWASTEYIESQDDIGALPVVDSISDALPYSNDVKGGEAVPKHPSTDPSVEPAAMVSATGLRGKLAIQASWGGEIYIYDLESEELTLLTGGFDPAISPNGKQVAFTRDGGENGIYIIDIDGGPERLIFGGREHLRSPKWSPDGRWIVFERSDEYIECRLDDRGHCLPDTPFRDSLPRALEWQAKLSRVDVNGSNYRDLAVLDRAHAPDWNAGGIVYHSPAGIQVTEDTGDARSQEVYFNIQKQYELDPDWQPNGGRIIFQQREASHWEIFSVALDGSGLIGLTRPLFALADEFPNNVAPAWSPDGQHIVFLSNRGPDNSAGEWAVWVMDADGSNQRQLPVRVPLTYTYVAEQMVDWGP